MSSNTNHDLSRKFVQNAEFRILIPQKTKHDAPHTKVSFGYDDNDDYNYNDDTEHW
jgi:hypothetical protein